ncbi:hypothetical protein ACJX0J_041743, partial [Zea mays]
MRFQGLNVTNYASLVVIGYYGKSIKDLALARLRAVKSLQIEECSKVTLTGILAFFLNCSPKFKSLSLSKCIEINDICSAPAQLPVYKSLRSLAIKDCSGFTDIISLPMVGMFCPQLENINLSGLSAVIDNGFLPLMKRSDSGLNNMQRTLSHLKYINRNLRTETMNGLVKDVPTVNGMHKEPMATHPRLLMMPTAHLK